MNNRLWLTARLLFVLASCGLLCSSTALSQTLPAVEAVQRAFQQPQDDSRIMMRWWWFGPSATREEVASELQRMKAAGIGGVELQATYPMAVDDPAHGFRNYRYLSPEFLSRLCR